MHHKAYVLTSLGLKLEDALVAIAIVISLPESYSTLRTILMSTEDKLLPDSCSERILITSSLSGDVYRINFYNHIRKCHKSNYPPRAIARTLWVIDFDTYSDSTGHKTYNFNLPYTVKGASIDEMYGTQTATARDKGGEPADSGKFEATEPYTVNDRGW